MRAGLLIAGVAVAVVGAGLMASLFFLPPTPVDVRADSVSVSDLGANATRTWTIPETASDSGSLAVAWNASAVASVSLWRTGACPVGGAICPVGAPLAVWNANVSGTWVLEGTVGSAYLLSATNFGHTPMSFAGSLTETYSVATPSQAVPAWALITIGGVFLLGIGGIAIFLGLFLEPGLFRPPRPGVARVGREPIDPLREFPSETRERGEL